jgi:class 3 adenylate cyclase/tetratricopeptide (TPR) repeat protein
VSAPVEDVRKTVTLLFCDVSGSTTLGEQLDPEVLRSVMGQYFAAAAEVVERHGGLVEKFVGDAVLAVFGIPVVREDDPLRAVRAAAELRDALAALAVQLAATQGVRLAVRTGINTGAVVAGGDRAGGSFATGDAVNTAARLEQAAPPGEVLLGESTYGLVRDAVEVEPVPPLVVKGKAEALVAYRLLRVLDVEDGRARRPDAALVGRGRERRMLDEVLERVVADRRCHLVTVLGTAGIGKTRLLADFERALGPSVQVLRGRCLSYGKGITFWPVVSVLRQAVGLTGEEQPDKAKDVLHAALGDLDDADADAVVARLAPMMGIEGEPAGAEGTAWAVRTLLEHLADARPVVIVVDDLQWAEPALLDLLEQLRDDLSDVPLLLVCPARPELLEQRPTWGGGAISASTLMLEPLTPADTSSLLTGLLGPGVPPDVSEAVNRWGGGNPLFLEEVATHLLEEGVLVSTPAGWTLTSDLRNLTVPPTLTALLAARLDRLPAAERALLEHASVIGLEASRDDVTSLLDAPDTLQLLDSLTRKTLLRRLRTSRGEVFAFRHVLVREAAYDAMPKAQRAVLHERYARRLVEHGADAGGEIDAFVGHHLEQAARLQRDLAPGAAGVTELEARAAAALASAAERAAHAGDNRSACVLLERTLALMPERAPARRRRLLELSWARADTWSTALARAAVEEGLALAPPGPPDLDHLALQAQQANLRLQAGEHFDPEIAFEVGRRAADAAKAAGDARVLCRALDLQLQRHWMLAELSPVPALAQEITRLGLPAERTQAWHWRMAAFGLGRMPYGEFLAVTATEDLARSPAGMHAHLHLLRAIAHAALGHRAEAEAELAVGLEAAATVGVQEDGPALGAAAEVQLVNGELAAAVEMMRRSIELHRQAGGLAYASTSLGILAALLLEQGDDSGAAATIEEAATVTSPHDVMSVAVVSGVQAVLAARAGEHDLARSLADKCVATIGPTDLLAVRGDLHRLLAQVPALRGDVDDQRRLLTEALAEYREKEHLTFAARTERELAALD